MSAEGGGNVSSRRMERISSLIPRPSSLRMGIGIAMTAIATTALGQGQIVTDPTRPPAAIAVEAPRGAGAGNRLQSVVISPTRRAAIIDGAVVELGGKHGDAVLTRVAEDEVVLKSGDSRQVLRLHPSVDKKVEVAQTEPVAPAAESAPRPEKAKTKAKPKTKARPEAKAGTSRGAAPAADGGAKGR